MQSNPTSQALLGDNAMVDLWHTVHGAQAAEQGWSIFDCDGSDNGRWQICKIDDPDGPLVLADDDQAWMIVMDGSDDMHECARALIMQLNPKEWAAMCAAHPAQAERCEFSPRTYEVTACGFDSNSDDLSDESIFWVRSHSAALLRLAISGLSAQHHTTIDGDDDIDFELPAQVEQLRSTLHAFCLRAGVCKENLDMAATPELVAFVQTMRSFAALCLSETILARSLGNPMPDPYEVRCKAMYFSTYASAALAVGLALDEQCYGAVMRLKLPEAVIHMPGHLLGDRWIFNLKSGWRLKGAAHAG